MSDKKTSAPKAPKAAPKAVAPKEAAAPEVAAPAAAPVRPKSTGARVPDVDKAGFDKKISALEAELKTMQAKQEGLNAKINEKSGGRDEFQRVRDEARAKLDVNQKLVSELEASKNKIQEAISAKLKESESAKADAASKQKNLGYRSPEEVDRKIAEIEYQMHTETLGLKRERELISEISRLKGTVKPDLLKLKNLKAGQGLEDGVGSLKAQVAEIQKQLSDARDEKRKLSAALGKIMDARKKSMEGVSDLVDERDKNYQAIRKTQGEIRALKDSKFTAIREHYAAIEAAQVARAERDKIEQTFKSAEGARRKLEDELINENALPFLDQIELAENTIRYCSKLIPVEKKEEEKKSVEVRALPGTSGTLLGKSERSETFFFAPTKTTKKATSTKVTEIKSFTHSLDTIALFAALKLTAPSAPKDVEGTVKALEAKIDTLKKKQVEVIAERKAKRSEKEAALVEATKAAEIAKAEWVKVAPVQKERSDDN